MYPHQIITPITKGDGDYIGAGLYSDMYGHKKEIKISWSIS